MADYDYQPDRTPQLRPAPSPAQLQADKLDLDAGLAGMAGMAIEARQVPEILSEIATLAVRAIPGADGAGVTLVRSDEDRPRLQTWAVTAPFVEEIDSVQYEDFGEGPCITCMDSRRPTVSGSLGSDARWPRFGGRVARMGVHSALALPLIANEQVIGAINSYAHTRDAFAEHAVRMGQQFAGPAAVSVYHARLLASAWELTDRLQRALKSRTVIDQAIGIVRSRTGVSAAEAFDRLTNISQSENVKLNVVAERLVDEAVRRARARHR